VWWYQSINNAVAALIFNYNSTAHLISSHLISWLLLLLLFVVVVVVSIDWWCHCSCSSFSSCRSSYNKQYRSELSEECWNVFMEIGCTVLVVNVHSYLYSHIRIHSIYSIDIDIDIDIDSRNIVVSRIELNWKSNRLQLLSHTHLLVYRDLFGFPISSLHGTVVICLFAWCLVDCCVADLIFLFVVWYLWQKIVNFFCTPKWAILLFYWLYNPLSTFYWYVLLYSFNSFFFLSLSLSHTLPVPPPTEWCSLLLLLPFYRH